MVGPLVEMWGGTIVECTWLDKIDFVDGGKMVLKNSQSEFDAFYTAASLTLSNLRVNNNDFSTSFLIINSKVAP